MAALKRFFVDKIENTTELFGEEFEHAKNVLRIGVGDEVILLDNSGKEYTAVVAQVEKKRMLLNVVREEVGAREASADVCLLFGYLKNADKNEFIVQKAVELGVKKIGVFSSEFSSAYMNANKLLSNRFDQKCSNYGRVNAARKGKKNLFVSYLLADKLYLIFNKVLHIPVCFCLTFLE